MANNSVVVRTAQDLERKYNFASLLGLKKNVEITAQGLQKIENELNSMLNALVINLKDVLDSQSEISLWFYSGIPTTLNVPYTSWANPSDHIGDLYYDQSTGYVYQYKEVDGTSLWEVNTSPDLVEAMAITNSETDTSLDHERKVFFDTPTIPYSNGDWWIKEDGSLFICQISKTTGTYEEADFIDSSKYTESIAEKIGEELTILKGTVTMISENYAKFTDLATGGSTIISGDNITTGNIQSNNYIENVSGTKIALEDGTIDAKNFKVDSKGNVEVGGKFSNFDNKGNLAIEIIDTNMRFYDYLDTGERTGVISSIVGTADKKTGIEMFTFKGKKIALGYKNSISDEIINTIIECDTNNLGATPWIINTSNGTMFQDNPGGGVTIENGLVKNWNLTGANGTLYLKDPSGGTVSVNVSNGIITGWTV